MILVLHAAASCGERKTLSPPVIYRCLFFNDLRVLFSAFTHLNTHSYLPLFTFQLRNLRTFLDSPLQMLSSTPPRPPLHQMGLLVLVCITNVGG